MQTLSSSKIKRLCRAQNSDDFVDFRHSALDFRFRTSSSNDFDCVYYTDSAKAGRFGTLTLFKSLLQKLKFVDYDVMYLLDWIFFLIQII